MGRMTPGNLVGGMGLLGSRGNVRKGQLLRWLDMEVAYRDAELEKIDIRAFLVQLGAV